MKDLCKLQSAEQKTGALIGNIFSLNKESWERSCTICVCTPTVHPPRVVQPLWKTGWSFFKKLKLELPYDPAIPLLDISPKEMKTLTQKDICTPMFITALFRIAKNIYIIIYII